MTEQNINAFRSSGCGGPMTAAGRSTYCAAAIFVRSLRSNSGGRELQRLFERRHRA
jgi:hypothetical protein